MYVVCHKHHIKKVLRSLLWAWLFLIDIRFTSHFGAWLLNCKKLTGHGLCCLKRTRRSILGSIKGTC